MGDLFHFFLEIFNYLFSFLGSSEIFENYSILDFIISMIVLLVIVDNFILKPAKGSSHYKVPHKSKGGK